MDCKVDLCLYCKSSHNKEHNMVDYVDKTEITLRYKINDIDDKIKIFGHYFVFQNKDNCKIIFEGKEFELKDVFELNDLTEKTDMLEIKLRGINLITNMEEMFEKCDSLLPSSDLSNLNTKYVENMAKIFYGCKKLKSLPDISHFNTSNIKSMKNMFCDCESLSSLPDISKWDTSQVEVMHGMFMDCESLISFPDISNWNTSKVKNYYLYRIYQIGILLMLKI